VHGVSPPSSASTAVVQGVPPPSSAIFSSHIRRRFTGRRRITCPPTRRGLTPAA
jgi:hypothetical protein